MTRRSAVGLGLCAAASALAGGVLGGCVDQHPEKTAALEAGEDYEPRLIVTSVTAAEICDLLNLDLVGVPTTSRDLPERYADVEEIGTPMAPDLEIVHSIKPDYAIAPNSLLSDLQPQFAGIGIASIFLDLLSVPGLYDSVSYLGKKFNRTEEAAALVEEYESFMESYSANNQDKEAPTVLVLMGLPGSYVVATENSYAGSLVSLAGGINVYEEYSTDSFINVNTEDMLAREPDIILRTAHALPDQVMAMFAEEFETNDIWKHFTAVQEGRVYDLEATLFGMSATFDYPEALEELQSILYG